MHIVQGTLNPTRHRNRVGEPVGGEPIGDAPEHFKPLGKVLWHEVVNCVPAGVLTKADRLIVELLCRLLVEMRDKKLTPALATQIRGCLGSLGMTPADRSRVVAHVMSAEGAKLERFFPL